MTQVQAVAWWVALAHLPDKLIEMGESLIGQMKDAQEAAFQVSGKISTAENNRHSVKLAAIDRLMKPTADGEKGRSFSQASDFVSSDEQYRDYLNHSADLQQKLDRHRHDVDVARLRFRLVEAALRRAVDEGPIVTRTSGKAAKGGR
jgi:hypothetical protein